MKGFTFYINYYELIKYLSNEERLKLYDSIFNYMFNDIESYSLSLSSLGRYFISS